MKTRLPLFFALILAGGIRLAAQTPVVQTPSTAPVLNAPAVNAPEGSGAASRLTSEQLEQLLGPIALYPDALIALILPAATMPTDVVLAARYLNGGDPAQIDAQPWDDSVKALAHYPELVKWMDENLSWTKQVGEAFLDAPAEVMKSVQRLRTAARAAGTLVDTPQQQVIVEAEVVRIVPAQPDVIYVPYYDPEIVYVRRPGYYHSGSYFSFSIGYPSGFWLGYNVDWGRRSIWVVERRERERYWRDQRDWRRPVFPSGPNWAHDPIRRPWSPNPVYVRPSAPGFSSRTQVQVAIVRPAPITREAQRPPGSRGNVPGRPDRSPGTRDNSRSSPEARSSGPAPAPTENTQPSTPPAQAQPSTPTTPTTGYSRGTRGQQSFPSTEKDTREERSRSAPPRPSRSQSEAPSAPSSQSAPAPTPAPAESTQPQSSTSSPQPISRVSPQTRSAPSASAAPARPSRSSSSSNSTVYSRGGAQSQDDRRD